MVLSDIGKFCSNMNLSSIGNEEDMILEPCVDGERVCIYHPRGVLDELFYLHIGILEDLKI